MLALKRVYDPPSRRDGTRVLVDRIWPRGVTKEAARLDWWAKDAAPSAELRRWFHHQDDRWPEFKRRYFSELRQRPDLVARLRDLNRRGRLTLVYAARSQAHNNAAALKDFLQRRA